MAYALSKSDYKVARTCLTKLYYKKQGYPTVDDGNAFMELLAEGGYMVGKLAQILYPGEAIDGTEHAVERTATLLQRDTVTIHEAAIKSNGKLVRIDILQKEGNLFRLIEVKAKSWNSGEPPRLTSGEWAEYIEDIAYQYVVLQEAYPNAKIETYLLMPDKAKRTAIDALNSMFSIERLAPDAHGFSSTQVKFSGDEKSIREDDLMTLVDVADAVNTVAPMVLAEARSMLKTLNPLIKSIVPISKHCKDCEFRRSASDARDGFVECWGKLADVQPHIFGLYRFGNMDRNLDFNSMIAAGKVSLANIKAESIRDKYNNRAYHQVASKAEIILPELFDAIDLQFPLHFIDFESSRMALPYHNGMRPYEQVIFQWSCHTLASPDADPVHTEWINTDEAYPNFRFAEALLEQLMHGGTVFIWTPFENTALREIYFQMELYGFTHSGLKSWLEGFVKFNKGDSCGYIDQADLCNKYYHHPVAKGKYSIKYILPAVLQEARSPVIERWLDNIGLYQKDAAGRLVNPYDALPEIDIPDAGRVQEGTAAVRAYQEMMYGVAKDEPELKAKWRQALLDYCRLDTLAMVIIWRYWWERKLM